MADFNFVPDTQAFNSTNAFAMGQAARLAYDDEQIVKTAVEGWGFEAFHFLTNPAPRHLSPPIRR
jgi:hypothetical protein